MNPATGQMGRPERTQYFIRRKPQMKKFLSLVLALVMTMSLVTVSAGAKDFTDSDKVTYDDAI